MESDSRSGDEYEREVRSLFEHAVRDEVVVAFGIQGIEVSEGVLSSVANAVINRIDQCFRFRWDPQWVKGEPHQWAEDGRYYARCTACLSVSPSGADADAPASWYERHAQEAHGG